VESGRYQSASEVVREALRLLDEQESVRGMRLEELRREIALGIKDLDEGRSSVFDESALREIEEMGRKKLADFRERQSRA